MKIKPITAVAARENMDWVGSNAVRIDVIAFDLCNILFVSFRCSYAFMSVTDSLHHLHTL